MNVFQAILLGIIEGITEFLPISSTGHLILTEHLLEIEITSFVQTFDIVIQLGAIGAVLTLCWRRLFERKMLIMVLGAFVPTAIIGIMMQDLVRELFHQPATIAQALLIGGVVMIIVERIMSHLKEKKMNIYRAMIIGTLQSIAIIPGTSRSAATIIGGRLLGIDRRSIVEFSFLLAIPTMLGASVVDLLSSQSIQTGYELSILTIGFVSAYISALIVIRWLLKYIEHHTFITFGIYRIILGLAVIGTLG